MDPEIKSDANTLNELELEGAVNSKKNNLTSKKILSIILVLVIFSLFISLFMFNYFTKDDNKARNYRDQGVKAYYSKNYNEAINKLKSALEIDKDNPEYQALIIKIIALEGSQKGKEDVAFKKGKIYIDEALKNNSEDAEVLISLGYLYETNGKYKEAQQFYNKALDIDPKNADAYFHKGHTYEFLDLKEQALLNYQEAYKLKPENPLVMMALAKIYLSQSKIDTSLDFFIKASNSAYASPSLKAEALTNAAIIERNNLSKVQKALEYSQKAVDIDDSYSPALAEYALCLFLTGNINSAKSYIYKAIDANPRISQNYWKLAAFLRVEGNNVNAIENYKKGIDKIDADNTILGSANKNYIKSMMLYDLARTFWKVKNNSKALSSLKEAITLNENLKKTLKKSYEKYGDFKDLDTDLEFKILII